MAKRIAVLVVMVMPVFYLLGCPTASAQRELENAAEFQQEIVQKAEQQAEDKEASQSPGSDISWSDAPDTGSAGSSGEAARQAQ